MKSLVVKGEKIPGNNVEYTLEGPIGYMRGRVTEVVAKYINFVDQTLNITAEVEGIEAKFILKD